MIAVLVAGAAGLVAGVVLAGLRRSRPAEAVPPPNVAPETEARVAALEALRDSLERRAADAAAELIRERAERERVQHQLDQARKLEQAGRLARSVAHEVNNMMTGVVGFTEMAESQVRDRPALVADLRQIKTMGERAAQVARQLLNETKDLAPPVLGDRAAMPLPRDPAPSAVTAHRAAAESKLPTGSERILVVEDEMAVRLVATRTLQSLGYTVAEAADGAEALEQWGDRLGEIDLVLSDVLMPRMGGLELAKEFRARRADLPMLLMSGFAGHDTEWGRDIPLLEKPFSRSGLAEAVRRELTATPRR